MDKREFFFTRVSKVLTEAMPGLNKEITLDSRYLEDLNATSLDLVTFVMVLEEELDISVSDEEIRALATVGETVEYLQRNFADKFKEAV